jgi:hypothetical protein
MHIQIGAYKKWVKRKVEYKRPVIEKAFPIENITLRHPYFSSVEHGCDKYVLPFVGYNIDRNYNDEELNKYINNGKIYAEYINNSNILDKSKYKGFINIISQGYALGYCHIDKKTYYFGFNKLEVYDKYLWEYDGYVEVKQSFRNEILEAFYYIQKKMGISMIKYIIDTSHSDSMDDEEVNHDVNEAINTAESILLMDNIKDIIIIIEEKSKHLDLKKVLKKCIKIWKQGAKIAVSY